MYALNNVREKKRTKTFDLNSHLIMKASSKIMRHKKEVISSFCSIPIRPSCSNKLYCTSHHPRRFERKWQAVRRKVTGRIDRRIKPVCFLWIESPNGAGREELVHKYLSSEHVRQTPWIFLQDLLVVFAWEIIYIDFQFPLRIVL